MFPVLDIRLQADTIHEPFLIWGSISRKKPMPGTYAFYCDDYKFEALWSNPATLLNTGCAAIVEPNFSLNEKMSVIVAAYHIYRKRWLAQYWQQHGVKIFVDVNVPKKYSQLNLRGVPQGWGAYCTRIQKGYHHEIFHDYAVCRQHAGREPLFVVYGGGNGFARQTCEERGWIWIPDRRSAIKWGTYYG